jgi:hypothetical protein
LDFAERLGTIVAETQDSQLAACFAYYQDLRKSGRTGDGFENAAARLPLSHGTAAILGRSRRRYREVVEMLMTEGAIENGELYCFMNRDYGLAAVWAEKLGNLHSAVKHYRAARDFEGALRCAQASGDEPTIARAREWRGEFTEALRIWKRLDSKADVARLLRRYPLLGG